MNEHDQLDDDGDPVEVNRILTIGWFVIWLWWGFLGYVVLWNVYAVWKYLNT